MQFAYKICMLPLHLNLLSGKFIAEKRFNILSNNLANISTPGFKATRFTYTVQKENDTTPSIADIKTYIDFERGAIVSTGNVLDLAIEGDGFFVIQTKEGTRYTRNGQFTIDKDKRLVTLTGDPVLGRGGEITIDGKEIYIENDGSISVDKNIVDSLRIVNFENQGALEYAGKNLFMNSSEKNPEHTPEKYTIKQGCYEASNVNVIMEMVNLTNVVRAYETYTKISQYFDELMSKLLDTVKL